MRETQQMGIFQKPANQRTQEESEMRLKDKVAVVTGAGSGMGAAIAIGYAREGARVACADINLAGAEATVAEIRKAGGTGLAVPVDVGDADSVSRCITEVVRNFGRIDILVNDAGISRRGPFLEHLEENWDAVMRVNAKGYFLCSQAAAKVMIAQGGGAIVNISSITPAGILQNLCSYAASKGAVDALTKHLALELVKHGIRVNAIAPGMIETNLSRERLKDPEQRRSSIELVPMGRLGKPEDVVGAAVFLASTESAYVTGVVLPVDGGCLLK
jgi:NAD(P)-dependent dehydrogenase (short-subunit alcohol dehydrogenase family)